MIEKIRERFIGKGFINEELRLQILIQSLMYEKKKYDFAINKFTDILSKLVVNQYQLIIEDKTLKEA